MDDPQAFGLRLGLPAGRFLPERQRPDQTTQDVARHPRLGPQVSLPRGGALRQSACVPDRDRKGRQNGRSWERQQGLTPRNWKAIGRLERDPADDD